MENIIPDYLDRDALLQFTVSHVNDAVKGDGCSIFLKDTNQNKFILSESTELTEHIGIDTINMEEKRKQLLENGEDNIGLTFFALHIEKLLNIPDVKKDKRWHCFDTNENPGKNYHCELSKDKLVSMILVPFHYNEKCIGLIRVVSRYPDYFDEAKTLQLEKISSEVSKRIYNAISFSELIATGSTLSRDDLCQKIVEDVTKLTGAKGCTIFLADNEKNENLTIFRAIASTGLYDGAQIYNKDRGNIRKVYYEINMSHSLKASSLTEYAIKNKKQIVINDVYSTDDIIKYEGLERNAGHGRFREYFSTDKLTEYDSGALIYSPILSKDNDQVFGLIRTNKLREEDENRKNKNIFTPYERRIFTSYVAKLTQILINIKFFEMLDQLFTFSDKDALYKFAAENATKLVGGRGCSILIMNHQTSKLEFKASEGYLKDKINSLAPYPIGEGWTGWVAKHKIRMMFNMKSELESKDYSLHDKPVHSGRYNECETGDKTSEKFLAVPILGKDNTPFGVIRVPKLKTDSDFTEVDGMMMQSLANHIGSSIENIEIFERQTATLHKAKKLFELGTLLNKEESEKKVFHIFMTGLTHGDTIGFNRAIIIEFDRKSLSLEGRMAIGPLNIEEGKAMREEMDNNKDHLDLKVCCDLFNPEKYASDSLNIELRKYSETLNENEWFKNIINNLEGDTTKIEKITKYQYETFFSSSFNEFRRTIDLDDAWFISFNLDGSKSLIIICDNIYDNKELESVLEPILYNYVKIAKNSINSLRQNRRIKNLMRARDERDAWKEASHKAAHKMGNAIFGLRGQIDWLKMLTAKMPMSEDLINEISKIQRKLNSANTIIKEFKKYAVAERLKLEVTDINNVVKDAVSEVKKVSSSVLFEEDYAPGLPDVKIDIVKFTECIRELVENSFNFLPEGGTIYIKTRLTSAQDFELFEYTLKGEYVSVIIKDSGIGIPEENKRKVFLPFFSTSAHGSGLGLSIIEQYIRNHHGAIKEIGKPSQGAEFIIALPTYSQEEK